MKQLSLYDNLPTPEEGRRWRLSVDGAARNNPGPAGVGIYLTCDDVDILKQGFFIGHATNNEAEYTALLLGLCQAKSLMKQTDTIELISDSELLVRQILGRYAVKNHRLKELYNRVIGFLIGMKYTIRHIMRSENVIADSLANEGIDAKRAVPNELRLQCSLPEGQSL